jgi:hypothetical protein
MNGGGNLMLEAGEQLYHCRMMKLMGSGPEKEAA